ncbi:hypothetical protein EVAR_102947_1 [Eumeta japonica]|uniref:Uncharacterized protein n=1 Tax=Eumeta variegata TaxID=151549 RepID=A0A4C1UQR6_EUMVA|nr:hypothetical protein EVAR_102947_1 [Eumeta japonica]
MENYGGVPWIEKKWGDGGKWSTGTLTNWTKHKSGCCSRRYYSVRVVLHGRAGSFSCCSQVDNSMTLLLPCLKSTRFAPREREARTVWRFRRSASGRAIERGRAPLCLGGPTLNTYETGHPLCSGKGKTFECTHVETYCTSLGDDMQL